MIGIEADVIANTVLSKSLLDGFFAPSTHSQKHKFWKKDQALTEHVLRDIPKVTFSELNSFLNQTLRTSVGLIATHCSAFQKAPHC